MLFLIKKINCAKKRKISKKLIQLSYTHIQTKQSRLPISYHMKSFYERVKVCIDM